MPTTNPGRRILMLLPLVPTLGSPLSLSAEQGGSTVLEEVVVTAHQRNYRLDSAKSALGFDLKLIETPAAISVITEDLLKDQQVNNVDDALRNVAGVNKFKTGNGGEEKFSIRGFDASQSIYKDGARINNPLNASNIPSTETANIDRIEVLKGSSALLYGEGKPGGIINYITKRPEVERRSSVEVLYGSDAFKKVEFDTTGSFGGDDMFAYRLVGAYEDSENYRDEVERERLLLNPTLAFMPNDRAEIVLGYEYIDDEYTQDRGQVLDGDEVQGYSYSSRLDPEQFFGIPGWNSETNAESERIYLIADFQVNDVWQVSANFSRTENDKVNFDSSPLTIGPDGAVVGAVGTDVADEVRIQPRKTDGEGETERYKLQNTFEFADLFGFEHKLLASLTYEDFETTSTSFRGDRNVHFNVRTGQYFTPDTDPVDDDAQEIRIGEDIVFGLNNRGESSNQDYEETGVNVLDYISFNEHWAWLIGGRYSEYEDNLNDFDDDDFSLRTGVVYSLTQDLSFYGSYAEGYTNSGGREGADGNSIDPETSTTWELGAKWQLFDAQLLLTATLYHVENDDLAYVVNPDAPAAEQYFDNIGTIESEGLELEAVGYITENWRIQAGYAYIDNEITDGGTGDFGDVFTEGNSLPGVADHNFNLFTFYEFPLGPGYVGTGGGVFYQDEVYISAENRGTYDDWTQLDLAVYYKQDAWKLQLNAKNVTDEDYQQAQAGVGADTFAAVRVGTASPRSYIASLAYEF